MMKSVLKALALFVCAGALAYPAAAQPKIAMVDLKKVFDNYYKTKQADVRLKEDASDSDKTLKGMVDDYQKANEEYKKLIDSANDQAVSSDEREKRKKTAETKLLEIQDLEKNVTQFRRQAQMRLEEQKKRLRDNILREIRETVNIKAKAGSFSLVLDTAAETINQTPVILYTSGLNDITDEVLTDINAKAPPGALTSAESDKDKDKDKDKPKSDKTEKPSDKKP